jgi:hypothetical protein
MSDTMRRFAAAALIVTCAHPVFAGAGTGPAFQARGLAAAQDAVRAALLREAEQALSEGPFSVMDKQRTAPGGDKHDFISLAPYWWPDPAKPGGLPYIRRDGEVNPESKRDTDDVPFGRMAGAVSTLAAAYRETKDERFASRAALLLRVWFLDPATRMNPNLDYGQGVPGRNNGRGAGIIATRRLVDVVDAARLLAASPAWTARDADGLRAWCSAYAAWLMSSRNGREEAAAGNNHGTWYDAQLAALLLYTGRAGEAKARFETAKRRLASQIEPDGRQPRELARTRSWSYSVMNLHGWFTVARLAGEAGVDLWHYRTADGRSLRAAVDYLVPFAGGDARWPHQQITPIAWDEFAALLDQAARVWTDGGYGALAARLRQAPK